MRVRLVEELAQYRRGRCHGCGEQSRPLGQRREEDAPALGALSEQDGLQAGVHAGSDEQKLADGAIALQDGRVVPARFRAAVRRVLVEQRASGAADKDPADEVAGLFADPAQELLFPQYQPCCGVEFNGAGLAQARGADQRLRQPAQDGVLCDGEPYVVGGRGGGGTAQGEWRRPWYDASPSGSIPTGLLRGPGYDEVLRPAWVPLYSGTPLSSTRSRDAVMTRVVRPMRSTRQGNSPRRIRS
jgi:hypothetical protein